MYLITDIPPHPFDAFLDSAQQTLPHAPRQECAGYVAAMLEDNITWSYMRMTIQGATDVEAQRMREEYIASLKLQAGIFYPPEKLNFFEDLIGNLPRDTS